MNCLPRTDVQDHLLEWGEVLQKVRGIFSIDMRFQHCEQSASFLLAEKLRTIRTIVGQAPTNWVNVFSLEFCQTAQGPWSYKRHHSVILTQVVGNRRASKSDPQRRSQRGKGLEHSRLWILQGNMGLTKRLVETQYCEEACSELTRPSTPNVPRR